MKREKIFPLSQLSKELELLRNTGKTIAHCHGVFDLVHPGHIRHFSEAKSLADFLVVTLTKDQYVNKGPGRPVFKEAMRLEAVAALEAVDFVALSETPLAVECIRAVKPHFYVKGPDYEKREKDVTGGIYAEEAAVIEGGGKIHFTHDITFSSTNLLNNHFSPYPSSSRAFLEDCKRTVKIESLENFFKTLQQSSLLVVGETTEEEHRWVEANTDSQNSVHSIPVLAQDTYLRGALAAAKKLSAFCKTVGVVTLSSQSQQAAGPHNPNFIFPAFGSFKEPPIHRTFWLNTLTSETCSEETKAIEMSSCRSAQEEMLEFLKTQTSRYDGVLVSPLRYDFFNQSIRSTLEERAKKLLPLPSLQISGDFLLIENTPVPLFTLKRTHELLGLETAAALAGATQLFTQDEKLTKIVASAALSMILESSERFPKFEFIPFMKFLKALLG